MKAVKVFVFMLTVMVVCSAVQAAQYQSRSDIPTEYKWKLEDIYPTDAAWEKAKDKLEDRFDEVLKYKGRLTSSASVLLECLKLNTEISKELSRLYNYASMSSDEDTRDSKYLGMSQQMEQVITNYASMASFVEPELAKMDKSEVDEFLAKEKGLSIYKMYLYDIQRTKAHTLSEKEEKILAQSSLLAEGPGSIYSIFSNADVPYPTITLSTGEEAYIDKAGYTRYRAEANRADREAVYQAFWSTFDKFKRTFGTQLYAEVKKNMFYAKTRGYKNSLERSLDRNNIPTAVYMALINNVHNNLDTFHRYMNLKKRMLGVEQLKYSDLHAPVVKGIDLKYKYDEGKELVLDAMKPLGKDYVDVTAKCFDKRWIDTYPTPGKRAGAYSNGGVYDVHPYILLNYCDQYEDVSTLAHELGHTMHSYYSNANQPYPTADYSIFVAEVASTFNEALLMDKMLKEIKDDDVRLSLLMNYLEGARQTLYRQTQFAEFELRIHEKAEAGEPLTGDELNKIYGKIIKHYYGHEEGVCHIDDLYEVEWAYIPHFYYNFYVYQYSTSFCASTALAEKVLNKEAGALDKYLSFLSAGGSKYPIELLKEAGVDMTGAEPFDKTMVAMNRAMDEVEAILERQAGK